jgi:hypothetical protein
VRNKANIKALPAEKQKLVAFTLKKYYSHVQHGELFLESRHPGIRPHAESVVEESDVLPRKWIVFQFVHHLERVVGQSRKVRLLHESGLNDVVVSLVVHVRFVEAGILHGTIGTLQTGGVLNRARIVDANALKFYFRVKGINLY